MGYPSQPQGPYGQQHPQQPYGSGPQYPPGYGYQAPSPPPPRRSNVGLIVILAVGVPLLLLGGCAAVILMVGDASTQREALVTTADPPNMVMPSHAPLSSAPSAEAAKEEPSTAAVGGALTLTGTDPALKVTVTLNQLFSPATPAQDFMKAKPGKKFVAVQLTLTNTGQAIYSDSPMLGAILIDGEGQQYRASIYDVREGQGFGGSVTINTGDSRKGVLVFEVPESATLAKLQFGLNGGFARQKGEWVLS